MPKQTGITRYECDRCGRVAHLAEGAPEAGDWREVRRVTADGVDNSRLFCKECAAEYRKAAAEQDAAFNAFILKGKEGYHG